MKPEDKYFKHGNLVLVKTASKQTSGTAGKKFGSPSNIKVKKEEITNG